MADVPATTQDTELVLTEQDAVFVAEKVAGRSSVDALLIAYPDDPKYQEYRELAESKDRKDREYGKLMLRRAAYAVSKRRAVKVLADKYRERMMAMGDTALDVLEEIMLEGSSEKVRADVAIEVTRQNLGNPDKSDQGQQNVVIMIGTDPSQQIKITPTDEVIDA